jgi:hypothetical protein
MTDRKAQAAYYPDMPLEQRQHIARTEARNYLRRGYIIRSMDVNAVTFVLELQPSKRRFPLLRRRVSTVVVTVNHLGKVTIS